LEEWKKRARERQTVYKELKNAGLTQKTNNNRTEAQRKWATMLGLRNYVPPQQRNQNSRPQTSYQSKGNNQVVPMDVDAGRIFTPLSEQERAELSKKGACFRCRQPGHISRFCPQKRQGQGGGGTTIRAAKAEEPPKEQEQPSLKDTISNMDPKELWGILQGMDEEKRMAIADGAQDF
jgi:Zinc knuckle